METEETVKKKLIVVGARAGTLIEVAPGQKIAALKIDQIERVALADILPQGDGTFRAVARVARRWLIVSPRNLRQLGSDHSVATLQRLIKAGFVKGRQPSPRVNEFDLMSYLEHLERCEDPEFWTERRRELYKQSI